MAGKPNAFTIMSTLIFVSFVQTKGFGKKTAENSEKITRIERENRHANFTNNCQVSCPGEDPVDLPVYFLHDSVQNAIKSYRKKAINFRNHKKGYRIQKRFKMTEKIKKYLKKHLQNRKRLHNANFRAANLTGCFISCSINALNTNYQPQNTANAYDDNNNNYRPNYDYDDYQDDTQSYENGHQNYYNQYPDYYEDYDEPTYINSGEFGGGPIIIEAKKNRIKSLKKHYRKTKASNKS